MILNTMCKLFFAIIIGFVLNKKDILNTKVNKSISSVIIQIANPCLIVGSVVSMKSGNNHLAIELLTVGLVIYIAMPIISFILVKVLPLKVDYQKTYICMLMFSNCGFMALPILQSMFGNQAVFYNTLLHMPYNLLFFTLGAYLLAKDGEGDFKFEIKQLITPGVISSILAIVLYFTAYSLPTPISESLNFVGSLVTPLSMISIGASIGDYPILAVLKDKSLYFITVLRLVAAPLFVFFLASLLTHDMMIIKIATISIGMPVGSMVAMGANEYNGNVQVASSGVALSTLLSLITIPIMLFILGA